MKTNVRTAIAMAKGNKKVWGEEWRVVGNKDTLYIQVVSEAVPEGFEILFSTAD